MTAALGIIGCGWAAGEIVRASNAIPGTRVAQVFDVDAGRAGALAVKARASVAGSEAALLADPLVDIVYVGLPHSLLAGTVQRALSAGKHVLCEKPLAMTADDARRLGALAEARQRKLGVFFELRRAGTVMAARTLLAEGAIGAVRLVRIRTLIDKRMDYWGPPGHLNWRARAAAAGGGVVMMNSIHQLDTLRYLTGLDYRQASAEIATFATSVEVEDTAGATLRLSNGAIVSLVAAAHAPGASDAETIEIDGEHGRINLPDPFGTAPISFYRRNSGKWTDIPVERPDSHGLMLAAYLAAVAGDGPVPAGAHDAAAALDAVEAIYRSAATGSTVRIR